MTSASTPTAPGIKEPRWMLGLLRKGRYAIVSRAQWRRAIKAARNEALAEARGKVGSTVKAMRRAELGPLLKGMVL